jgi:hypothetical protein
MRPEEQPMACIVNETTFYYNAFDVESLGMNELQRQAGDRKMIATYDCYCPACRAARDPGIPLRGIEEDASGQ